MDEWQGDLRRAVIYCGNDDKPVTFYVDEYKMVYDQMYADLECLLRNNMVSEITRKQDIMLALANIFEQATAEQKGREDDKQAEQLTTEQLEERGRQQDEQQMEFISDNKKMMQKWPHVQAECHKVFLNRVKRNFHLVLQYTPTGGLFHEKLLRHQELLYYT